MANTRPTLHVKHIGDGDYKVAEIYDPYKVLPAWIRVGTELTAGQCHSLNREYGEDTVRDY